MKSRLRRIGELAGTLCLAMATSPLLAQHSARFVWFEYDGTEPTSAARGQQGMKMPHCTDYGSELAAVCPATGPTTIVP